MSKLTFTVSKTETLSQILRNIKPYLRGQAYKEIVVVSGGKTRFTLNRIGESYMLFGCPITPELIDKRYKLN